MKTKKFAQILYGAAYLLQVVLLGAVFVVQALTTQKAGVNHHVRFTRTYWMYHYLTPQNVLLFTVLLALGAVLLLVVLVRFRTKFALPAKAALLLSLLWIAVLMISLHLEAVRALLVYPYLLLAELLALLLSIINLPVGCAIYKK